MPDIWCEKESTRKENIYFTGLGVCLVLQMSQSNRPVSWIKRKVNWISMIQFQIYSGLAWKKPRQIEIHTHANDPQQRKQSLCKETSKYTRNYLYLVGKIQKICKKWRQRNKTLNQHTKAFLTYVLFRV